jgi:hypothetical protein
MNEQFERETWVARRERWRALISALPLFTPNLGNSKGSWPVYWRAPISEGFWAKRRRSNIQRRPPRLLDRRQLLGASGSQSGGPLAESLSALDARTCHSPRQLAQPHRSSCLKALSSAEPIEQMIYVAGVTETRSPQQPAYAALQRMFTPAI